MSNEDIIRCFENDAIPEGSFHHADHVRLSFAYLCEYPLLRALEKFSGALKRFADLRGKAQLYNEDCFPHLRFRSEYAVVSAAGEQVQIHGRG
jgi:hypothetical protein